MRIVKGVEFDEQDMEPFNRAVDAAYEAGRAAGASGKAVDPLQHKKEVKRHAYGLVVEAFVLGVEFGRNN